MMNFVFPSPAVSFMKLNGEKTILTGLLKLPMWNINGLRNSDANYFFAGHQHATTISPHSAVKATGTRRSSTVIAVPPK